MALTEKVIASFAKFIQTFKGLYSSEKLIFGGLGSFIIVLVVGTFLVQVKRNVWPYQLILVAGRTSGESYILSDALARVVEDQTNIRIDVCATGGTEDNLHFLEGLEGEPVGGTGDQCRSGKLTRTLGIAQLATAQADRVPEASARLVAILYEDRFQLLVNSNKVAVPSATTFDFNALIGKTIDIPEGGGQRESFKAIARHFKPSFTTGEQAERSFNFQDAKADDAALSKADAVFRVRILGSEEISNLLQTNQWQLVPLEQAQAMQSTRHPAYNPSIIPEGTYQGSSPIPSTDLETIAVQRTLLAREDVPDWVVEKITRVLSENRKELKDAIQAIANEREATAGKSGSFDSENISPLVDRNKRPPEDISIPVHKGANAYYERDRPAFVQANADFLALLLTLILLVGSWLLQLKSWSDRQKQMNSTNQENIRKEKADVYIKQVVEKMKLTTKRQTAKTTLPDLFSHLKDLFDRQEQLDFIFQSASASLDQEEISQEGFRAFSEAYKSAKEVIERAITEKQRKFSSYYVEQAMNLLDGLNKGRHPDAVLTDLDTILKEATEKSIHERIFSRESFRTLTDVYGLIRNAIELKKAQRA